MRAVSRAGSAATLARRVGVSSAGSVAVTRTGAAARAAAQDDYVPGQGAAASSQHWMTR